MATKKKRRTTKTKAVKTLPPKALTSKQAKDVKGGSKHIGDMKFQSTLG
jgi:hypothetical protein